MLAILGVVLALSLAVIVLVFSMVVNERRREIGVLAGSRGHSQAAVLRSLLTSAVVLALTGGAGGHHPLRTHALLLPARAHQRLRLPLHVSVDTQPRPAGGDRTGRRLGGVLVAAFLPAYRISRQDPAMSMRE